MILNKLSKIKKILKKSFNPALAGLGAYAAGFIVLLVSANNVFAFDGGNIPFNRGIVIRQETFEVNGVMVCQPVSADKKIADIIRKNNIRSLSDYLDWLADNVSYAKDEEGDSWALPEDTLNRKYGDCEDYAFLNAAVLNMFGYETEILAMGGLGDCHAICVFKKDGYYLWIDNTVLEKVKAGSKEEFAKHLFDKYGCCYLLSLDFETKDWRLVARESELAALNM